MIDLTQVPGKPGPDVRVLRAQVFFGHWPVTCWIPDCSLANPQQLVATTYTDRVVVGDPLVVERLWKDYEAVKSSSAELLQGCSDDARIMVVFDTSEPALRWFAAGQGCEDDKVRMVTEGRWLHEKNGPALHDMAEVIGVTALLEAAVPDIFH